MTSSGGVSTVLVLLVACVATTILGHLSTEHVCGFSTLEPTPDTVLPQAYDPVKTSEFNFLGELSRRGVEAHTAAGRDQAIEELASFRAEMAAREENSDGPWSRRAAELGEGPEGANDRRSNTAISQNTLGSASAIRISFDYTYLDSDPDRQCTTVGDFVGVKTTTPASVIASGSTCDPDDSSAANCKLECTEEYVLTDTQKDYIKELLEDTKTFYNDALLVNSLSSLDFGGTSFTCNSVSVTSTPAAAAGADIVLMVTARPTLGSVLAYASSCAVDQRGRPIFGFVNFGPNSIEITDAKQASNLGVAIHETAHALGFQSSMLGDVATVFDTTSGTAASATTQDLLSATENVGSGTYFDHTVTGFTGSKALEKAREHFSCPTMDFVEMENGGGTGTAGSHWEKRILNNEFMTGSSSSHPQYSKITLGLFEDTGWYQVNYDAGEDMSWGRGLGCDFVESGCSADNDAWSGHGYFCSSVQAAGCTADRTAKGYCTASTSTLSGVDGDYDHFQNNFATHGDSELSDYCPFTQSYSNGGCDVVSNASPSSSAYGESYGDGGLCMTSSLMDTDYVFDGDERSACHRHVCTSATTMVVNVNGNFFPCPKDGTISLRAFNGDLKCPDPSTLCWEGVDEDYPTITEVSPSTASPNGGETLTITGTNLGNADTVTLEGISCTILSRSATEVTCSSGEIVEELEEEIFGILSLSSSDGKKVATGTLVKISANSFSSLSAAVDFVKSLWEDNRKYVVKYWWVLLLLAWIIFMIWRRKKKGKNNDDDDEDYMEDDYYYSQKASAQPLHQYPQQGYPQGYDDAYYQRGY